MKRVLILLILSVFLVVGVFAQATGEASSNGPTTVSICITDDREAWLDKLIEQYKDVRPDVTIEKIILYSTGDRQAKMTMMMQSPKTCPDIMNEDGFKINADAIAGYLSPLDDYISTWDEWSQFYGNVQEMGRAVDGKVYGIPLTVDVLGLWYDKVLLKEAGVEVPFAPKSWDDVLKAAEKVKALGKKDVIPYFITVAKTFPERASMRLFQPLYNGTGHSIYNAELGKWTINKKAFMDVCEYVNTICNVEQLAPPLDLGVQNQVETILQSSLMKEHKVGIWLSGNWMCRKWDKGMDYEWPNVTDEVGFVPIPTQYGQDPYFTSMSGGWTLTIPENAQHKDEAWKFIEFISSKSSLLDMALRTSELTVRKDVAEEPAYKDSSRLYVKESSDILEYTKFRPSLDVYTQVSLLCTEAMETIGLNTATLDQVYNTFVTSLKEIVGEENLVLN